MPPFDPSPDDPIGANMVVPMGAPTQNPPPFSFGAGSALLLEDGSFLLLEDGVSKLLLEP